MRDDEEMERIRKRVARFAPLFNSPTVEDVQRMGLDRLNEAFDAGAFPLGTRWDDLIRIRGNRP